MSGTIVSQAIPIAMSPILTRLFSPKDFGVFALFISISTILSVVATGRYELAILLPLSEDEAFHIMLLSMLISIVFSLFLLTIILIFNHDITILLGNSQISFWLYFIPVSVLFVGVYQGLNYWLNRKKKYQPMAISRVAQSGTTAISNIGSGFTGIIENGLIVGTLLGQGVAVLFLFRKARLTFPAPNINISRFKALSNVAIMYNKFPKFDIPSSLLNVSSHQLLHVMFNTFFNATISGYFYLTQRILGAPVSIVSSAILDVFKEEAAREYSQYKSARKSYLFTLKKLVLLGLVPSIILYIYSVDIFTFVFGNEWKVAGEYASIMAPMLFIQFVSSPLSFMFYIGEKQEWNLYLQGLLAIMILLSFYFSISAESAIVYLTFAFSIFYFIQLLLSSYIARCIG